MSSLKLHGTPFSTSTQRCILALQELDVKFEFVLMDLKQDEQKKPSYLALQPFGQVPLLEDGPFILYESRAIVNYIVRKYGNGSLLPRAGDVQTWARYDQFASIESTSITPDIATIFMQRLIGPAFEPDFKFSQETVDKAVRSLSVSLSVLNDWLSVHPYLSGSSYTTLDMFLSPIAARFAFTDEGRQLLGTRPHVQAYLRRVTEEREAWKKIDKYNTQFIGFIANLKQQRPQAFAPSSAAAPITPIPFQPKDFATVLPYIIVKDCVAAIDFYKDVFSATEIFRMLAADKKTIVHAELKIGSAVLMLSEENDMWKTKSPISLGQSGCALSLYVPDADAVVARAQRNGLTKLVRGVQLEFWGDRMGTFIDPFGHSWMVCTHVKDVDFSAPPQPNGSSKAADEEKSQSTNGNGVDTKVSWKAPGKPELMPHLYLQKGSGVEQINFYVRVFGAMERFKMMSQDPKTPVVMHGELQFGDMVVLCSENCADSKSPSELGGSAVSFVYYVKDVDSFVQNAVKENGVKLVRPTTNEFYGARAAVLTDPFGYKWNVQTQIENLTAEQLKLRSEQMAAKMSL